MSTTSAPALDRATILNEAYRILQRTNFSKEDSSRVEAMLGLAESLDGAEVRFARLRSNAVSRELGLPPDSKLLRFLRGRTENDRGIATYQEEKRDMGTTTGAVNFGSPLGAPLFSDKVIEAMKQYDQLYDFATWVPTATGTKFTIPSDDDTATSAVQISENTQSSEQDFSSISATNFDEVPIWRSGAVKVSRELFTDSGVNLEAFFAGRFAVRFARGLGAKLVSSVKSGASVGKTTATNNAILGDEIYQLASALDAAYAMSATCAWLMRWSTLLYIWQIKDDQHRYQFHAAWDANGHPLLLGKPVLIAPSMDDLTGNGTSVAFGDVSRVFVRHVDGTFAMKRADERFADYFQSLLQAFWRIDGTYTPAGTGSDSPIVTLKQHS